MTDLEGLGISQEELIGIGESGTGEWEVYCCTQDTAERLHHIGRFNYTGIHATEMYLLGRQLCTIRVHWLPLRVNNDEVFDWVSLFSDQVEDIVYEASGSSKAKGLLTGTRKIRCFLRDGIEKTDVPYDTEIMAYDGSRYRILVSVEGREPRCLKCGKLRHIRRDCKAKKCAVCRNMTDEHVTANCSYKGTMAVRARFGKSQPNQTQSSAPRAGPSQMQSSTAQVPQSTAGGLSSQAQAALGGMTEQQLSHALTDEDGFQTVTYKKHRQVKNT